MPHRNDRPSEHPARTWARWLVGAAILSTVVYVALHTTEQREIVGLLERARPSWLLVALVLQAGTYLALGFTWRTVIAAAGVHVPVAACYRLTLTKHFIDRALPSAGISGTLVVAQRLQEYRVPRETVLAAVVVDLVAYYFAYTIAVLAAIAIAIVDGFATALVVGGAGVFMLVTGALSIGTLTFVGRADAVPRPFLRIPGVRGVVELLGDADAALVRNARLIAICVVLELAIILLDAASLWVLVHAVGASAPASGVFASLVIATLVWIVGFVPGGLGTFEAAAVAMLTLVGVPAAAALSATLLYRGLSFWLPLLPGVLFARGAARPAAGVAQQAPGQALWSVDPAALVAALESSRDGLSSREAAARRARYGANDVGGAPPRSAARVLADQVRSPLLLLLVFAAAASIATGDLVDAAIVIVIVIVSAGIGFWREYSAQSAAERLRERVHTRAAVVRDGVVATLPVDAIVPGDVVQLSAGSLVPADAILLEATDFHVNQAVLTGESFPVEKRPGAVAADATLAERTNEVFFGTNVRTGVARALVVATGRATQFGGIAERLTLRPPETEFDRGIRRFGYLLTIAMLVMVLVVFAANVFLGRPVLETLLFAIALAVGLSPELLPAILSVNLARGAQSMAQHGVLVRRLNAIENLGSMDILCTDKTGTLTEGAIRLDGAWDVGGARSAEVLELASINAALQAGLSNPLDAAILAAHTPTARPEKLGEIPYDFVRKRLSVIVRRGASVELVTKGSFEQVLDVCSTVRGAAALDEDRRRDLRERVGEWGRAGTRVLAVAVRELDGGATISRAIEREMTLVGFLTFLDAPKAEAGEALRQLGALGVSVRMITGDARLVAEHVGAAVGMPAGGTLSGRELDELSDESLWRAAETTSLFVEVDPNQKERIILALKKTGHVVGFLGDGVNDAPAMHAADTSLSVEGAVDVAREAADFVLLERDLDVIRRGVVEGRRTFANTLKYILTTTSANLGNMLSMAVASLFLPFLPLLAGQVLLNNFLSDIPAVGLASDSVDAELVDRPRRWDMAMIGRFMIEFGALSSVFDLLTFVALLLLFDAGAELFRTGWFVESLLTELLVALVVRTRRPIFRSRPGVLLVATTAGVIAVTMAIALLPIGEIFGFVPLPPSVLGALGAITVAYVVATELLKAGFYRSGE